MRLSVIALFHPNALIVELFSNSFLGAVKTLVDLGSSNSFIDPSLIALHKLFTRPTSLLPLFLIDGTVSNFVKEIVTLPINLACDLSFELDLFVTPLARECPIVLGHSWLKSTNSTINWTENTLNFLPSKTLSLNTLPSIALIGAKVFLKAC